MMMSNSTYDKLVPVVEILLPMIAAIVTLFGETFGIPFAATLGGFIMGVAGIMGMYLGRSRSLYQEQPVSYDGELCGEDPEEEIDEGDDEDVEDEE